MINKNRIKLIKSLSIRKSRLKHQLFIVEGKKNVNELLKSDFEIESIWSNSNWAKLNPSVKVSVISNLELEKISNQKNPNDVLAIVRMKNFNNTSKNGLVVVLDNINDPGNLGTIIRACDWFGVSSIVCSNNSVDMYNPKTVQSSMGSVFRVNIIYTDLIKYLVDIKSSIVGAFLEGESIRDFPFDENIHLVMGNEANGISEEITKLISRKIKINNYVEGAESLNVAIAASIFLYEIRS